jgi:hypothetical protein
MSASLIPKYRLLPLVALLVLLFSLYLVFFNSDNENKTTQALTTNNLSVDVNNANVIVIESSEKTIATAWQWEKVATSSESKSSTAFSEETVYKALHRVRLDDQGGVVIDNKTLIALDETLNDSRLQLDSQSLNELKIIIKQGLPGNVGEDVAKIVGDYYQFLGASKEFNSLYEGDLATAQYSDKTTEQSQDNYRELMSLREVYLGTDVAKKLFSISDANANYMFDMAKVDQNTDLTNEEKKQHRASIIERHTEKTIGISNWKKRYSVFLAAKHNIQMVLMSMEEKQMQLTELMHQHFNLEELSHVRHLQLDNP